MKFKRKRTKLRKWKKNLIMKSQNTMIWRSNLSNVNRTSSNSKLFTPRKSKNKRPNSVISSKPMLPNYLTRNKSSKSKKTIMPNLSLNLRRSTLKNLQQCHLSTLPNSRRLQMLLNLTQTNSMLKLINFMINMNKM